MSKPPNLAELVPSPWPAFFLGLVGAGALAAPWEAVFRVLGAFAVLAAVGWLAVVVRRNRSLVARIQEAVPLPEKGERLIRELPRAWSGLEQEVSALKARLQGEVDLRQALLSHLNVGVVQIGADRRIALFNGAAQVLLGASSRLASGGDLVAAFREPDSLRAIEAAFQGQLAEWDLRRNPRLLHVHAVPFESVARGKEPAREVLLTLYDMTRQEALELTRQKFISNASHELRTPTTSIRIAAENLMEGQVTEEGEAGLRSILRSVDRMTMLLDDISELSRIETGALALEPKDVQVGHFVDGLVEDVSPQAQARAIRLVPEVAEGLREHVFRADPFRLHQLLENLLSNAVKFSPGNETVRLRVWRDGRWLAWAVEDRGPGIGPGDAPRIFERFYRAPSARGVPGTGLGLSIVKHLSVLMGGEVDMKSEPGKGATFTLRLPWTETRG